MSEYSGLLLIESFQGTDIVKKYRSAVRSCIMYRSKEHFFIVSDWRHDMVDVKTKALVDDLKLSVELKEKLRAIRPLSPTEPKLDLSALLGTWCNCDPNTRGIVKIELTEKSGTLHVHVYGACHPTPCDWGPVAGISYAESVVDNDAIAFTALYDHGFAERILTGRIDCGSLIVETYSTFKDGSGRSNYYSRAYLCRCNNI